MGKPKVSVILASYNHEEFVGKAIESVISQSFKDWELIIIDDCSKDGSVDVIKQYKDSRIQFFEAKVNKGPILTFNELMEKAQGDYIAILGSDDIWYQNKLQVQIEYMEKNNEIAVCFSHVEFIDENGIVYSHDKDCDMQINVFNQRNRNQGECFYYFFLNGNFFCHPSSVIRRSVVDEIGGFDLRFRQLHDYYYWIKILQKYPVYVVQEPLVLYRRIYKNDKSVSAGTALNSIRLLNEIQVITFEMIRDMDLRCFVDAFSKLLRKPIDNEVQLICEKYFVLLQWRIWGYNNIQPAIWYIDNYINNTKFRTCMEKEYGYSLNDYYVEKARTIKIYPLEFNEEHKKILEKNQNLIREKTRDIESLNNEIEEMRNTISWKITKPLRNLKGVGKTDEY